MSPFKLLPTRSRRDTRPNAFGTDIRRTITSNPKRFVSLFIITALGATMLVGLKAACDDLRATADAYYDAQRLFDISIRSTLGLDDGDIEALAALDGVETAEGGYTEAAYTQVDGRREKVDLRALSSAGLNEPLVLEGRLPRDVDEVAVTQKYLNETGKGIGDTVTFEGADEGSGEAEDDTALGGSSEIFRRGDYTITASVLDPMDVNAGNKTMSFRSSSGTRFAFFFAPVAVEDRGTYTIAYLSVAGASELPTYSDGYEALVEEVKQRAEGIRAERELARTQGVKDDALEEVDAFRADADAELADAEGKLADAQSEIDDALALIEAGRAELAAQGADGERQLADAAAKLAAARAEVEGGLAVIDAKQAALDAGREQALAGLNQVEQAESSASLLMMLMGDAWPADAWERLHAGDASARDPFAAAVEGYVSDALFRIDDALVLCDVVDGALARLPQDPAIRQEILEQLDRLAQMVGELLPEHAGTIEEIREAVANYMGEEGVIDQARAGIQGIRDTLSSLRDQVASLSVNAAGIADAILAKPGIEAALAQIEAGDLQLAAARAEANRGLGRIEEGEEQLERERASARAQMESAARELDAGAAQAASGQVELDRNRAEFERQEAEVETKFADARRDIDDIDRATWYIQDRTSLPSYASVESDASSIEAIATVFPLIFFTVAVLISLTTVTRMVEEDRGLIGVYKALGYSRRAVQSKYLIYSFSACLLGGLFGDVVGFVALPSVLFTIFKTMYSLPAFQLHFDLVSAFWGVGLFSIGIVGATFVACRHVLRETPASLMRPKAPRAGRRILLERITPLWRRLGFLNKVSARNLFRYKKRFLMTVFGIAGCTALMICGLGIRDTVISLKPRQYGDVGVTRYDLMAVSTDDGFDVAGDALRDTGEIDEMLEARVDSVTVGFGGAKETVQLIVVPRGTDLDPYVDMRDDAGSALDLPGEGNGALVTKNAEQVLGFAMGDELQLQDAAFRKGSVRVDGIATNYLGNFIFMTEDAYAVAFGERVVPNAYLANLDGSKEDKIELADELAMRDEFVAVSSSAKIADDFSENFKIIDVVVAIVTVMAAALAFAVVFTLSNTNISERERELATIKVLGFRRGEVHRYINKETIVLTLLGIVAGFPMGYAITRFLTFVLRMPSLYFDTIVEPATYLIAAVASMLFTLIINQMTNRSLDRIDMVGALKSAE
ncbi:MAG: ABC transporter permease [Collinsella sp.]|nr:ABC transporter permease [Collinsella sp.]